MIRVTELAGINPGKLRAIRDTLDALLTDEQVITGYNWYGQVLKTPQIVTFSHMHETERYKSAMLQDLSLAGYSPQKLQNCIRAKYGCFHWKPSFIFRDSEGAIFPNLYIRKKDGTYLNLATYPQRSLDEVVELQREQLISENEGWELNIGFKGKEDLLSVVELFLKKSSQETPNHWPGAYDVPVLIIGDKAIDFASELPDFLVARKMLLSENGSEVSFIVRRRFEELKSKPHYADLRKLGFVEELCLGNRRFIQEYVDI
jgi:hypothetical protein